MSLAKPSCPSCNGDLVLTASGAFDTWVCPSGHGLAATLSESYERVQDDEISRIWQEARRCRPTGTARRSPTTGASMVSVKVEWDADEIPEGDEGDGANLGSVWLDVDVWDQVIWFDDSELGLMPEDLPDAEPTPEELESLESIRRAFGDSIDDAAEQREEREIAERIYRRIARHRGLTRMLTEVGSLGRR